MHNNALIVIMKIASYTVTHILINNGSLVDILYWDAFKHTNIRKDKLDLALTPFFGFSDERVIP